MQILADHAATVFAGARTPDSARSLQDLKKRFPLRLHLLALDVTDQASVLVRVTESMSGPGRAYRAVPVPRTS